MNRINELFAGVRRSAVPGAFVVIVVAILCAILVLPSRGVTLAAPLQDATVRCSPHPIIATVGEATSFNLYVDDIAELYGADVRLSFDTTKVQVVDADPNAEGVQIEPLDDFLSPDFVVRKVADNVEGTIWYASVQINPSVEVSGSGPLARVTIQPLVEGEMTIPFTYHKLVKRTGVQIPTVQQDCRVIAVEGQSNLFTFFPVTIR